MKQKIKKWLFFLTLVLFTTSYISCEKEGFDLIEKGDKVIAKDITFEEFKSRINMNQNNKFFEKIDVLKPQNIIGKLTQRDFIQTIHTSKIKYFHIGNGLQTFTMPVTTNIVDDKAITNIVYYKKNDTLDFKIIRYLPSLNWLDKKNQGITIAYEGTLEGYDSDEISLGSTFFARARMCPIGQLAIWICNAGHNHEPGTEGCDGGNRIVGYETLWDYCPSNDIPGGGGNPWGGGSPDDLVIPTDIVDLDFGVEPCELLSKLNQEINFIARMKGLATASIQYRFEKVHVLYEAQNPTLANQYQYNNFQGTDDSPIVNVPGNTTMKGIIHSHFADLLSIFSAYDLQDLYFKMKDPRISDNFFVGVVCPQGNAYLIQISNRASFVAFGDKYLATELLRNDFDIDIMQKKYEIQTGNYPNANEKGFLKMMNELNIGINLAKSVFDPTTAITNQNIFNNWQKIKYNLIGDQVETKNCN